MAEPTPQVSIVLPVFNEVTHLEEEVTRISKALDEAEMSYEIIVVDDGSTDDGHRPGGLAKESPESGVWGPSNDTLGAPPDMWYTDRHVHSIRARLGYLGRDAGVISNRPYRLSVMLRLRLAGWFSITVPAGCVAC